MAKAVSELEIVICSYSLVVYPKITGAQDQVKELLAISRKMMGYTFNVLLQPKSNS